MNFETVKAVADIGIRIDSNDFMMVLTHLVRPLPESLDDESVLVFIADNMCDRDTEFFPSLFGSLWRLIDRPRLRQQLIERRILPQEPACVTACLNTVGVSELGEAEMVELARRAVKQGARVTESGFISALYSGSINYAQLAFEITTDHDLAQWKGALNVWRDLAFSHALTVDMCHLVLDAGFMINREDLVWLVLTEPRKDGDVALQNLRAILHAAEPYKHEIFRGSRDTRMNWPDRTRREEEGLPEMVGMLLESGFRPSAFGFGFVPWDSLPKTKKVAEEFLKKNGLSIEARKTPPAQPTSGKSTAAGHRPTSSGAQKSDKGGKGKKIRKRDSWAEPGPGPEEPTHDAEGGGVSVDAKADDWKYGDMQLSWIFLNADHVYDLGEKVELEDAIAKMAEVFGLAAWREDMSQNIMLSFYFNCFQFAKDGGFSPVQISTFFSIMKIILDRSVAHDEGLSWEVFDPSEVKLITDYAFTSLFQNYKLYMYVMTTEQEQVLTETEVFVEKPPELAPLAEAITLEAYETERARIEELELRERLEREQREADLAAAKNPFDVLSVDDIRTLATDVILEMMRGVAADFEQMLDDQRGRFGLVISRLSTIV
ncbi:hypothetical protein HK101_003221 [Irineochytrium annulatum]|nr:hypothetical protein HK101_003221 [Irineochytrium annulatum]